MTICGSYDGFVLDTSTFHLVKGGYIYIYIFDDIEGQEEAFKARGLALAFMLQGCEVVQSMVPFRVP